VNAFEMSLGSFFQQSVQQDRSKQDPEEYPSAFVEALIVMKTKL